MEEFADSIDDMVVVNPFKNPERLSTVWDNVSFLKVIK